MILVYTGGEVQQQMLTLAEPVPQVKLTAVAERLNALFENSALDEIASLRHMVDDELGRDVAQLVLDSMARADRRVIGEVYRDGLANIMDNKGTRQAVRVLEEGPLLSSVLEEMLEPSMTGVQVVIGGDGRWEELKECSMIVARYGQINNLSGAVALLGPTRMPYGRNISAVRYVADLMSGLVHEYYLESPADVADPEDGDEVTS
jgi:heat-inducible transcriptional repressor